jgi:hypothetical protein
MSTPQKPRPAKLVIGMFMPDKALFRDIFLNLTGAFGSADAVSQWFPFDATDYYAEEMGSPLFRRMVGFLELIEPDGLVEIKGLTNDLERRFAKGGKRRVNIDPGYIVAERYVLATGKNYTHRINLRKGIYADLTLIYQKGRFRPLDWTYPDYAGQPIIGFLTAVREKYLCQMRA